MYESEKQSAVNICSC